MANINLKLGNECPKVHFTNYIGSVSDIIESENGFAFKFGENGRLVSVFNAQKPDWLCDGVIVEIDFNNKTITKSQLLTIKDPLSI